MRGIGVDMVDIREIQRMMELPGGAFVRHTFTAREQAAAEKAPVPAEYLAARFAAKEAVFKAIAHFTKGKGFDLRIVETLNEADGYPYIVISDALRALMDEAGFRELSVSITTETDYAVAFVIAE